MATVNEKMTAIADAIRDKTGETEALTLDDISNEIPEVYEVGHAKGIDEGEKVGYSNGYREGEIVGKAEENRAWWDALLFPSSTSSAKFEYRFQYIDFEFLGGFNPPYVLKPTHAGYMFRGSNITKLTEKEVDFSGCNSASSLFQYCNKLTVATGLDLSKSSAVAYAFNQIPNLHTLDIILGENGRGDYVFWQLPKLENLTVGGVIKFTATLQHSKLLTAKSIESVVSALSDSTTGNEITFSIAAKTTYYNAHSSEYANADEAWNALCATKSNWTISLV